MWDFLRSTQIKKSRLNPGIAQIGGLPLPPPPYEIWAPEGHFSPPMSIDAPDVNTTMFFFLQRKSNELQVNYTQYPCNNTYSTNYKKKIQ